MPVQLPQRPLLEVLLRTSNVLTLRQIINILRPCPATREDLRLGERKGPFQIGHGAGVNGLAAESVGVLEIKLFVCPAWEGRVDC